MKLMPHEYKKLIYKFVQTMLQIDLPGALVFNSHTHFMNKVNFWH